MIKDAIKKVIERIHLSEQEMIAAMTEIMEGRATDAQIACLITGLRMKGETVDEITGAAKVMRQKAASVPLTNKTDLVDIVGTGGDGTNTFNISTAAAFVACGAGLPVAKHGNRAVTSMCGSADVMEKLGIKIDISPESVARCINEVGIGFLFAPRFHPAMKYAAPARRETGMRSIFNLLGPLTNPADSDIQVVGVYDTGLTDLMCRVLKQLGRKRALVVHGNDGLDELSLCTETQVSELKDGKISSYTIHARDYVVASQSFQEIQGGTAEENAEIILSVFNGNKGPHREIVLLNAGAAIMASGKANDLKEGVRLAAVSIDQGSALKKLEALKNLTGKLAEQ
ncbi:MAG: anthranilate phosphoribosyltransferase [Pseudomonadota bacterium]